MSLAAGTRLGSYEITGWLGVGGMGEVYRATDSKLGREIAIKTLPAALAEDRDRLARFEREAKLLASLNHAHIASVHSLDEHDGTLYIAMELVEGETLEDRLKAGRLSVEDALQLGLQIALALEAAHEKGVIHRDLKPANIVVTPDDAVKVLDFGLAKSFGPPDGDAPTLTNVETKVGQVLGTAPYMSPEQARGEPASGQSDIWSFGVVLYEMLTGASPFERASTPETLARVLVAEPDFEALPPGVPMSARHLIRRCLEKKAKCRLKNIGDVRIEVENALADVKLPQRDAAHGEAAAPPRSKSRAMLPLTAGLIIGALVVGSLAWRLWPESGPATIKRYTHPITQRRTDDSAGRGRSLVALAPDGRSFVYSASDRLYLRSMDRLEVRPIPGTDEKPLDPFFSPDGKSVAYFAAGALKRISLSGGTAVPIASGVTAPLGASWDSDGTILFGQPQGIFRVSADGGTPELVIRAEQGERLYGPEFLPDGDSVLFSATTGTWDEAQIVAHSLSTEERTTLLQGGSDAHYVSTGHLVYAFAEGLFAVAFDPETLKVSSGSVSFEEGLTRSADNETGTANYGIAADGTLVHIRRDSGANPTLVWVDRDGKEEPTGLEGLEGASCSNLALSPDGTRLAFDCLSRDLLDVDIWIWSFAQQTRTRLTSEPGYQFGASWSPDSSRIAYGWRGEGLVVRAADGTGMPEQLLEDSLAPWDWMENDELIFTELDDSGNWDIGIVALTGDRERRDLLATEFNERRPVVSPNGRWLAYQSDESGQFEIYVRPFPNVDARKWPVSAGGGEEPRWSGDGRTLFFLGPKSLMETHVGDDAPFTHGTPEPVFDRDRYLFRDTQRQYDVSHDGQRFLLARWSDNATAGAGLMNVVIVENWVEELKRRVPRQ